MLASPVRSIKLNALTSSIIRQGTPDGRWQNGTSEAGTLEFLR
jgi:hypothetical protein